MEIAGFSADRELGMLCGNGKRCTDKGDVFAFLLENRRDINAFCDLDSDVAAILGMAELTPRELEKLNRGSLYIAPYTLTYYAGKLFVVARGFGVAREFMLICDAGQYDSSLRHVEEGDESCRMSKIDKATDIIRKVYDVLVGLGFRPKSIISPANVFRKEWYDTDRIRVPSVLDVEDDRALEMAQNCCKGNWVESFKVGHWDKVYDYDLSTAYPSEASKLLHLADGHWMESDKYQPDAEYGYVRAEVTITAPFSPIIYKIDMDRSYTPTGTWDTFLTKAELEFIKRWELGSCVIQEGHWWFPREDSPREPLQKAVKWLHEKKNEATGLAKDVIKRMLAGSFYGLFLEARGSDDIGKYYMPPYGAEIETNTRLKVAKLCLKRGIVPIAVVVDGVVSDRELGIQGNGDMGKWRLSHTGKCLSLGTGMTVVEGKVGEGDLSIGYDWLLDRIKEEPDKSEWGIEGLSVMTLGEAEARKRLQDVGKVVKATRTVGVVDGKRDYVKAPRNGRGLLKGKYESRPWSVKMLKMGERLLGENRETREELET